MNTAKTKDNKQNNNINKVVLLAMLTALSAVGAYIVIPAPTGTVALDSAPGYLASLLFGSYSGSIVLGMGFFISMLLPLTVGSAVNVILAVFFKKILGEKIKL